MFTQRPSFRYIITGAVVSLFALTFLILGTGTPRKLSSKYILKTPSRPCPASSFSRNQTWDFVVERDGNNHGLSEDQCRTAFPKLYNELDKSSALRADRHFTYKEFDSRTVDDGMVRGIIDRGEVSKHQATLAGLEVPLTLTSNPSSCISSNMLQCPSQRPAHAQPSTPSTEP
jgi:hypothetical protein